MKERSKRRAGIWPLVLVFATPWCSLGQPPVGTLPSDGAASDSQHSNRLADETSPYLLMHAHNPVEWFPWGPEALGKAKRENKVIFLSVGYSSCHWCHVMERESFMDPEIAAILNKHFVSIKVDREERPDVDAIYMKAVQIFSQINGGPARGGWPMTAFLTPDTQPFFAGTYYPARDGDRGASTGFLTLVQRVQQLWQERAADLQRDATTLTRLVKNELDGQRSDRPLPMDQSLAGNTLRSLSESFDQRFGGFGFSESNPFRPKFPEPSNLMFLAALQEVTEVADDNKKQANEMLLTTLDRMAMGGIRDHLGGGFHRYSVDRYWRIPHFEKMLYDNAQLATVYAEAYRLTGRADYRRVVEELLDFVNREMTDEHGAFYAALDADSEGEEGKFYRWTQDEIRAQLDAAEYELLAKVYGLNADPNFEEHFFVLQLDRPLSEIAKEMDVSEAELDRRLAPLRHKLLALRGRRPRPLTDTKILTSWNGLMIRGFADAGQHLNRADYLQSATRAADFVLSAMRTDDGRLQRTFSGGSAKLNAYLDDYAFLVDGLLALHRATGEPRWLDNAADLMEHQIKLYWDEERGGFFFTSEDHESLIARGRDPVDGAQPSGNSVSADNLVSLASLLNKSEYLDRAERTVQSAAGLLRVAPAAAPRLAIAVEKWREHRHAGNH